ncbi:hypothetical protein FB567DRAFT_437585 [Paraphoma chrysanthemicola]|uniref:Uncharacterized protein n=1 Tax=Paraphoma chrysanthemicola TaxID=798071 RepID=A0A8K0RDU1_9PLEO|nr:hypothetical protein FB567DRAFT_437585 [Paraphoma chrysanthemicola]
MFGHPGISALEYAGQVRKQSICLSEGSLKRKSSASAPEEQTTPPSSAGTETVAEEVTPPVHYVDEFGCQQRRRGTFINHTPRNFELRSSKAAEVYRPSGRGSENYSRPLSRQGSMASTSPALSSQAGHVSPVATACFDQGAAHEHHAMAEAESPASGLSSSPEAHERSKSHRRSFSAPLSKILTYLPSDAILADQVSRGSSFRSSSTSDYHPQDSKRQRRQTPFRLATAKQIHIPRHAPIEPFVAKHRQKEEVDAIGDVPFDMDREVSAEIGTFGVIQRYFDSQGGGLVASPTATSHGRSSNLSDVPLSVAPGPTTNKPFMEPIAIYPIDESDMPDGPPPVPERSPKRLTNPSFPLQPKAGVCRDSDFQFAAEGEYSPYDKKSNVLHVAKKRTLKRLSVEHVAWVGSPNVGKLAPPILSHDALTASSDLGLNDLSFYLKNTRPPAEPQPLTTQRKKKGMRLFKVKPRKSLAARVGSVEGSPERARSRPAIPACAREMTTSGGAKHLRIIIPTEAQPGSQLTTLPITEQKTRRRSRHISIAFTEEMLNPLASADVERIISGFDTPPERRSFSAPATRSPRSPKASPKTSKPVPVKDHPLASRDEQTRARKLRDLQRIKRKPVPGGAPAKQHREDATAGALPTPAQTPEPAHEDEGIEEESPLEKMGRLQDRVVSLQRQNTQLAEALAKIVGLDLKDGDLDSEEVLRAFRQRSESRMSSLEGDTWG